MKSVNYNLLLIFLPALLSGLLVYFILSYLLISNEINLPLSFVTSVLIFGLANYYYVQKERKEEIRNNGLQIEKKSTDNRAINIVFIITYVILLAVLLNSFSSGKSELYTNWENLAPIQVLNLTAAIAFSFFLPGYALVTILNKKYKLRPLLKLLLAYLFSILITGLGGYISGSFGSTLSNNTIFFIGSYLLIFLFYLQQINAFHRTFYYSTSYSFCESLSKIRESFLNNYSQFIVFSSLFALVVIYTYYLNDGKIIVDQWYHHGRALLIASGLFKDLGPSDITIPPFFSSFLAAFFNLSGSPSVNAYVAIGFLNIIPVFAFYYFFTNWVPKDKQRAALLASTLFMLSSGFGWLYAINAAVDSPQQLTSDISSSLNIFGEASRKTFDISTPTTFIDVGHPDVTTPLLIIALPAGFTLLGMIRETKLYNSNDDGQSTSSKPKSRYSRIFLTVVVVTAISFVGILSHDEFFLFIVVATTAIVILYRQLPKDVNYSIVFVSFLAAISMVIMIDMFISPAKFYTFRHILSVPLIILCFLFVSFSWALYLIFRKIKFSNIFKSHLVTSGAGTAGEQSILKRAITLKFLNDKQIRFVKLSLGQTVIAVVAYFYLFTLLVWDTLSVNEVSSQIKEFANVPWYLYPMKFGLTGLLGLAFVLSYLFKKFEKEIFIFGIMIIIAFFAGPYYDEHRFGKYIMAGMAAFAAILIYQIISSRRVALNLRVRPLIVGVLLGIVVTSSSLSIFMYGGWIDLFKAKTDWIEGGRRDFPTTSEIQLLNFLDNKIIGSKIYNVALPEKETSNEKGFVTKIYGFSPTSRVKLLQSPLTLNASTLEGLYGLLDYTNVGYIILPKSDIITDTEKSGIMSSSISKYDGNISSVLRFVLDNFPKAYEDQNYIVLEVLPFTPPSPTSSSNVGLIYQRDSDDLIHQDSNYRAVLPIETGIFGSQSVQSSTKNNSDYDYNVGIKKVEGVNRNLTSGSYNLVLGGNVTNNNSRSITLWSAPIQEIQQQQSYLNSSENNRIINYVEGNFKMIDNLPAQNKSDKKNADKFGAGIWWEHDNKTYLVSVRDVGLQLSESPSIIKSITTQPGQANNKSNGKPLPSSILSQNEEIKRQQRIWYNLKILFLKNNVEIYVNDILRAKISGRDYYNISSIEKNMTEHPVTKVGINTYYSKSEFQPIILGHVSEEGEQSYPSLQKIYYQHYYPLSTLALSKIKYDASRDGDLSAFSNKYVVLPFDKTTYQKNEAINYLEYVNKGGNLIVINSDNIFNGTLFPMSLGNLTKFNSIESLHSSNTGEKKYGINVSGIARSIEINPHSNLTVKSYYVNKNGSGEYQKVAPFVIEKNYGKGSIIFVNAKGYFDTIFGKSGSSGNNTMGIKTPYFATLSKLAPMIGIPDDKQYIENNAPPISLRPTPRIIGDIRIAPKQTIIINSSNVILPDSNSNSNNSLASYNLTVDDVSVSAGQGQQISITNHRIFNNNTRDIANSNNISSTIKNTDNGVKPNHYDFKKVQVKDLELYGGPFQIIINVNNSTRPLYLPTTSSYNDYIAMSIPKGFDMTVKFSDGNSTHSQIDMVKKNDKDSFQRIKVSSYTNGSSENGNSSGQIIFRNVRADIQTIRYISALLKSPEIRILNQEKTINVENSSDEESNSVTFRKYSPDSTPIEIKKGSGNVTINVDHVESYDEPYHNWIRTKFITYLKNDIQITQNKSAISQAPQQSLFAKLITKKPGDISEYAKEHGIEVPWREVLSSTHSAVLAIIILAVTVTVGMIAWSKIRKVDRIK